MATTTFKTFVTFDPSEPLEPRDHMKDFEVDDDPFAFTRKFEAL